MQVLDLFSAAAGGWSLGLHRAGFKTIAACESEAWRRVLYAENNPGVKIYDEVRALTAARLAADGIVPDIVVGSPPCQDISSANTKGRGVEGERSGLFFEAVRIIGEVRPRWFALENSANLRTRGADRVLGELEGLGYACWAYVVGGDNIGANHERKRSWLIGCDVAQLSHPHDQGQLRGPVDAEVGELQALGDHFGGVAPTNPHGLGQHEGRSGRRSGLELPVSEDPRDAAQDGCGSGLPGRRAGPASEPEQPPRRDDVHAPGLGHEGGRSRGRGPDGDRTPPAAGRERDAAHADQAGQAGQAGQADGCLEPGVRQAEIADDGCGSGRGADGEGAGQMGLRAPDRGAALQHRADWSLDDLADSLRLDDGLPAWVAGTRIAVGGPRGTSAASLIVEAFGDSVLPQIPEAIGRAILRTEAALDAIWNRS